MTMTSKLDFNVILAKCDKNTAKSEKLLEEKRLQKKLLEQKKSQPSKEATQAYLEKKREEAKKRAEQEAKELLEKKRKKLLAEKQNEQKPSVKKSTEVPTSKPSSSKPPSKKPLQVEKTSSSAKASISSKPKNKLTNKPLKNQPQKPTLSYQDILKMADQNKDKPKTATDIAKPKESNLKSAKPSKSNEPSSSTIASSSSSLSSKLTPEQIAKLKEKQKKPNVLPIKNTAPTRTDINNNNNNNKNNSKKKPIQKEINVQKFEKPANTSQSAWDRIMSDMKKTTSKVTNKKSTINSNESDEGERYDEEDEYDSEMEDFIDDEEEDSEEYRSCIRKMFKYDPNKYKDEDDDLADMETDYHTQMREEKRSLRLGIMEDIEEMKREAEMERRRMEKKKKRHVESDSEAKPDKKIKK